ncbi:MAG TPA: MOSC N-terminal beta barrel domain-containing protein [Steroidobacteraceae bacterium]|nr:MOSC N-terminal beta barrel domain-containing protein [Steroidobacteraceae bacterium]
MSVRIAQLWCYPLKSAGGIALEQALLGASGLQADRSWMLTTPTGRFLTQREVPRLALIRPILDGDTLQLHALQPPGTPRPEPPLPDLRVPLQGDGRRVEVRIWKDGCLGVDAGDEAARWLARVLQRDCRLVRFDPARRRLSPRRWTGAIEAENRFSDGFPLLVISEASLEDLNSRLQRPLPMSRFRPNIVLAGAAAYDEDRIDELSDGPLRLKLVRPCARCRITTTNQETAELEGDEPLTTLKSYRYDAALRGVLFGQNALIVSGVGSLLRRGQSLQVRWKPRRRSGMATP